MTSLSTHVLDAATGQPSPGMTVTLDGVESVTTDADGRARFTADIGPGDHRLTFATGAWFAEQGRESFFPEVVVAFVVPEQRDHLHVPLLLSPFAYSTYRGS